VGKLLNSVGLASWWLQKRGWGQTLMELISPLLMMSLVVWGWSKSKEDQYGLEFPVNSTIPLFQAFKNEYGTAQSLLQLCPPDRLLSQVRLFGLGLLEFIFSLQFESCRCLNPKGLRRLHGFSTVLIASYGDCFFLVFFRPVLAMFFTDMKFDI